MKSGRARIRKEDLAPALFPFLAVMVCTIGALVLILGVAVSHASREAKAELQSTQDQYQMQEDFVEVATKELHSQREELQEQINRASGNLTHLEDHIQRIEKELAEIAKATETASNTDKQALRNSEEFEKKKSALQKQLEYLQAEITEKAEDKKTTRPAFCIIPYKGPNGTSRRPIYIECTAKGVTIQPEGKLLTLEDLRPPHGPGNPLDAALRAIRAKMQQFDGSGLNAAAYPLLIVRPNGIASYTLARAAMAAWDDQHGYELIEADMPLTYPPSMPGLKEELDRVVARAQQRQQDLIASLPKHIASSMDRSLDAQDLAVEYGDASPLPGGRIVDSSEVFIAQGTSDGPQFGGSGNGRGGSSGEEEWPELSGSAPMPKSLQKNQQGNSQGGGPGGPYNTASMSTVSEIGQSQPGGMGSQPGGMSPQSGGSAGFTQGDGGGSAQGGSNNNGSNAGANNQASQMAGSPSQFGSQGNPFAGTPTTMSTGNSEQDAQLRQEMSKSDPSQPTAIARPASNSNRKGSKSKRSETSIANEMGDDWAVQRRQLSNTPIHRAIHIKVLPDRWQIVDAQSNKRVISEIFLGEGPRASRQQLHTSIRKEVSDWGVAVSSGYWVPIIKIYESPDSAWAAQQLSAMLEGSGAKIEVLH